ncbi:uncharacterized protein DUF1799 [Breoghania corrubedonensis]|uniref:Uncharacterized protein DUF1799 n=1 Tax=Breoghania corrubedonensis TaxID=665038 RepID=A0A2T5VCG8_9HYPH|nr:DUF1799 domain-containing protein [Breoghania corrubedonensis]PTW61434.1 uncharacterized protein DUF1799 [Breoghania corrubedonensis]
MQGEFAALGVMVAATEDTSRPIEVWSPHWEGFTLFLDLSTQWRATASPAGLIWLGLDYGAAEVVMRARGGRLDADLLSLLRDLEQAALPVLNQGD